VPNPPCLDELLNETETSYCLVSPLMMSLQIDERVFMLPKRWPVIAYIFEILNQLELKFSFKRFPELIKNSSLPSSGGPRNRKEPVLTLRAAARVWRACVSAGLRRAGTRVFPSCMAGLRGVAGPSARLRRRSRALRLEPPAKPLKLAEVISLAWHSVVK